MTEHDKMREALAEVGLPSEGFTSLGDVLEKVFDAADEDDEGVLRHGELLKLLEATLCTSAYIGIKP